MSKSKILVVDDDPDLCELVSEALSDSYSVQICMDAEDVEENLKDFKPPIILMDINLPKISGLELSKKISGNCMQEPLILLTSGDNSLDTRLQAYNHGAADFLPKPFRLQELQAKVDALRNFVEKNCQLQQNSEFATRTAMNAMAEASQYGEVLRFYNGMYKADSVEKIKDCFFDLMKSFNLHCTIQLRVEQSYTYDPTGEEISPIELQIFENLCDGDRLIPFSNRLMINGVYTSIIVKNMPVDDEVNNGRMRDILATLIEGVDAKLLDLQRLNLLKQTSRDLALSSNRLATLMKDHETFITGAMNFAISEINSSFHILELTEKQEEFFTHLTEGIINSMEESFIRVGNETDVLDCIRLSLSAVLNDSTSS